MAGYGAKPGERRGGRRKGTKNKATIERELEIAREVGELNGLLGKDFLAKAMIKFHDLALHYAPGLGETPNPGADEDKYVRYMTLMGEMAHKLAPFESPRFASISYEGPELDASVYTDDEIATLKKLVDKGLRVQQSSPGRNGSAQD